MLISQLVRRDRSRRFVFWLSVQANDDHDHDRDRHEKGNWKATFSVRRLGQITRHAKSLAVATE